jgi:hypothetical protein
LVVSALLTDPSIAEGDDSTELESVSTKHEVLFLVVALLVTTAVWTVLFVVRVQAHQANVDDYAYADLARNLFRSGNPVSPFLHSGSTSPLVPALAAPGASLGGVYGAMAVELPFLLLLVAGSYYLARQWTPPLAAMVAALAVALNEDVSSYAVMLNFAVPTAAALVWAVFSYIRSRHFRDWKWSLIFGASIAALLLSRSMSLVYVVPLLAVIAADLLIDTVKHGHPLRLPALGAVAITLVLAGPWWLVSGPAAIHYLHSAGYQPSSGYTSQGLALNATTIRQRTRWTLAELGWGESWVLAVALLAALWAVVRHHRTLRLNGLWMLGIWVLLTGLILSTSSNNGTGFGLPVIVILILLAASILGQMSWRPLPVLGVVLASIMTFGLVAEATGTGSWWPVAPYRGEVVASGGTFRTNSDLITAQVTRFIGSTPTLVAQDSDILNGNGIGWYAGIKPLSLIVLPSTGNSTPEAIRELARVNMVITGSGSGSYHPLVNQTAIESSSHLDGFHVVRLWMLGTPGKYFAVWERGIAHGTVAVPSPTTNVVSPRDGAGVKGSVWLIATASTPSLAVQRVEFTVSGMQRTMTISATQTEYGWLGGLNTTILSDGTYTIRSTAVNTLGEFGRSEPVAVQVDN